jgi:hypothetical protein
MDSMIWLLIVLCIVPALVCYAFFKVGGDFDR